MVRRNQPGRQTAKAGVLAFGMFIILDEQRRLRFSGIEVEHAANFAPDSERLGQPSGAELAAGHRAFVGLKHSDAALPQEGDVAHRGGMLPHPHIHRRHGQNRLVSCQQQGGGKIVGNPARHLGEQVCSRRADDHQVGLPRELDMPHLDLVLEVPQGGVHRIFAERGQRQRGDELRTAVGQHAGYLAGHAADALADQAHKLAGLVGRDAATNDQQDARTRHGCSSAPATVTMALPHNLTGGGPIAARP